MFKLLKQIQAQLHTWTKKYARAKALAFLLELF